MPLEFQISFLAIFMLIDENHPNKEDLIKNAIFFRY